MRNTFVILSTALALAAPALSAAQAPPRSGCTQFAGTVNGCTSAEERQARSAAARAGYTPAGGLWAQAGTVFMNATKDGNLYQLTVLPSGTVYASTPIPAAGPGGARP